MCVERWRAEWAFGKTDCLVGYIFLPPVAEKYHEPCEGGEKFREDAAREYNEKCVYIHKEAIERESFVVVNYPKINSFTVLDLLLQCVRSRRTFQARRGSRDDYTPWSAACTVCPLTCRTSYSQLDRYACA